MELKQKRRDEIPQEYQWKLEHIYESAIKWQESIDELQNELKEVEKFKGNLNTGQSLLDCLNMVNKIDEKLSSIFAYARMRLDEEGSIPSSQAMTDKAQTLWVKVLSTVSFVDPEILALSKEDIQNFISSTPGLELYNHYLNDLMRKKPHVLSAEIEKILADSGEIGNASSNIYNMLKDTDLKFGTIVDENGDTVTVTQGRFISLLQSSDRRVRKETFELYYDAYLNLKNTMASLMSSNVKKDVFFSKTRNFNTSLEASLHENNIPTTVYEQLVKTVNEFLPALHKYMGLRKKVLKLDELHAYDLYVPIVENVESKISYEDAKVKLVEGLRPLGEEYIKAMQEGMKSENGWIDVYENENKSSGAYAWGTYSTHPYVLLNYDGKMDDMFTLAHEMGHAMHSFYSNANQPYMYAGYSLFLAEVASTVNEALLMEYMLKSTTDKKMVAYLLNEYLEQFRTTVFRQVMFAEFEAKTHEMVEDGQALTMETLNGVYRELNEKYYGKDVIIDDKLDIEWARIPHFYRAFYVYQYATGYSSAIAISQKILQEGKKGEEATTAYLEFLKAGGSDYPINVLKKVGVDMESPEPVREALKVFEGLINQLQELLS